MPEFLIFELDPAGGFCGFPAEIPGLPPAETIRQELIRRNRITNQLTCPGAADPRIRNARGQA